MMEQVPSLQQALERARAEQAKELATGPRAGQIRTCRPTRREKERPRRRLCRPSASSASWPRRPTGWRRNAKHGPRGQNAAAEGRRGAEAGRRRPQAGRRQPGGQAPRPTARDLERLGPRAGHRPGAGPRPEGSGPPARPAPGPALPARHHGKSRCTSKAASPSPSGGGAAPRAGRDPEGRRTAGGAAAGRRRPAGAEAGRRAGRPRRQFLDKADPAQAGRPHGAGRGASERLADRLPSLEQRKNKAQEVAKLRQQQDEIAKKAEQAAEQADNADPKDPQSEGPDRRGRRPRRPASRPRPPRT